MWEQDGSPLHGQAGRPEGQSPFGSGFPVGAGSTPVGTRFCLQSLVCYTLVPADAEKGLLLIWRASFLWQKDERAGVVSDRF